MNRRPPSQIALACAVLLTLCGTAAARAGGPLLGAAKAQRDLGTATLVSEVESIAPGSTFLVSFHLTLPEGWHTYWRFAGDSGGPPSLNWSLPPGFRAGEILYPAPARIKLGSFVNFGYEHEADFLVAITAPADVPRGAPIGLAAKADWLVCSEDVCIPRTENLSLALETAGSGPPPQPDEEWNKRIADVVAGLPRPAPFEASLATTEGEIELYVHDRNFTDEVKSGEVRDVTFFPYEDGIIKHAAPQTLAAGGEGVALRVPAGYLFQQGKAPEPLTGLLVLEHRGGAREAFEISARRGASVAGLTPLVRGASLDGHPAGIFFAAALALLGGLLLTLMPCVFPVLSMKVLGFLARAQETPGALRRHGWTYASGVVASFLVLAAGLYVLRAAGAAVGWGYQLQSPILVLLLAYLMFGLALVLLDVLRLEPRIAGIGQSLVQRGARRWRLLLRRIGDARRDAVHRAVHGRGPRICACGAGMGGHRHLPSARPRPCASISRAQSRAAARPTAAEAGALDGTPETPSRCPDARLRCLALVGAGAAGRLCRARRRDRRPRAHRARRVGRARRPGRPARLDRTRRRGARSHRADRGRLAAVAC
ncbi:MAG: protein-disulfide reductase DsbD family protein [Alphaproteobacteria bacterium]